MEEFVFLLVQQVMIAIVQKDMKAKIVLMVFHDFKKERKKKKNQKPSSIKILTKIFFFQKKRYK